ncbi:SusC/RagA family TonB-linked outer membrane protein [Sinomicrobium sp. M5D2P9]
MKFTTLAGLSCWCPITIAFILLSLPLPAMALPPLQIDDQHQVTGTVTDSNGEPLGGVNIIVSGKGQGTISDFDGTYALMASPQDTLVYSFVGFKTRKERVGERLTLNVVLKEDVMALGEVTINAGYYTVKERERTGSISRITAEDIDKQPVANPLQALAGRMPGVQVTQQSGVPGGGFTVRVRGQNSIRTEMGVNDPLYIVDGVPFPSSPLNPRGISNTLPNSIDPFNSLNPSDIESIEVLKDADATAIYGSRGANGVVLITTKKGVPGKTKVDINLYSGTGRVTRKMDLLHTRQYLEMRHEAIANDNWEHFLEDPVYDTYFPDLKLWDSNRYTDWQKELIGGTAYYHNLQGSLSGGNDRTRYLLGGGYFSQTTVYPGDNANRRISGHFNFSHTTADQKLQVNLAASYTSTVIDMLSEDLTLQAVTLPPNAPALYNGRGQLNWENSTWTNPLAYQEQEYEGVTDNFISSLTLEYRLLPGLSISSRLGYTNMQVREMKTEPLSALDPAIRASRTGRSRFSDSYRKTWIIEPQITYKKEMGQGRLNLLLGGTFQQNADNRQQIVASGYTSDALLKNIRAAPELFIGQSDYSQYRYNAVFGRINYTLKGKYILNLTGRRDGSSRFGPGREFANFGAVGMAWLFSEEQWFKDSFIAFGKLRGSYGTTGSDAIGDYGYLDTYSSTTYPYQGRPGLVPTRLANPDYGWETNKKLEAGLELGFADNRISLTASWYRNRSSGQLVGLPLPAITGQSTIQYNLPAIVENRGWEFVLHSVNINKDSFGWTTDFNISIPENRLLEYQDLEGSPYANRYRVGKSLFVVPGYYFLGVDPQTGLYTFEDVDGNGSGTDYPADIQFRKEITQQYYGGLQNTITYKRFSLDVFLQFVKQTGRNYFGDTTFDTPGSQGLSNQPTEVLGRWQQPGDITEIQRFSVASEGNRAATFYRQSDGNITDASYIRLSNLSLSWDLPVRSGFANHTTIYLRGQNLLTFTGYKGLDPETRSSSVLPPLRILTLGIRLSF